MGDKRWAKLLVASGITLLVLLLLIVPALIPSAPGPSAAIASGESPIIATIDIDPGILNLGGGKEVTAYIELPAPYNVAQIDGSTVFLEGAIPAIKEPRFGYGWGPGSYIVDHDGDGILERKVKFDGGAVANYLKEKGAKDGDVVALEVTGMVAGSPFGGSDTIVVRGKGSRKDGK